MRDKRMAEMPVRLGPPCGGITRIRFKGSPALYIYIEDWPLSHAAPPHLEDNKVTSDE